MKIIYIANARIPTEKAHGYQICKMCEEFARAGHEVDLVVPFRFNPNKNEPFKYYGLEPIFGIVTLPSVDLMFLHPYLPWLRTFWLQYLSFSAFAFFYGFFKQSDIIYSRDEAPLYFLSFFKKNLFWEAHVLKKNILARRLYRTVKKIFVITEALKNIYIKAGVAQDRIAVAPDAVDLNIFDIEINRAKARQKLGLPPGKTILGYTGSFKTMGEDKGLNNIFEAIKILADPKILLVAVGGSETDIKYYKEKAESRGIKDNVILVERKSRAELAIYQKACDMLLMPFPNTPHYAYYMSPLKMFEYMASQRPIIASDLPSIREVLNDDNAVFVKPDSPSDLAEKIKYLKERTEPDENISALAHATVKKFTWEKRAKFVLSYFLVHA